MVYGVLTRTAETAPDRSGKNLADKLPETDRKAREIERMDVSESRCVLETQPLGELELASLALAEIFSGLRRFTPLVLCRSGACASGRALRPLGGLLARIAAKHSALSPVLSITGQTFAQEFADASQTKRLPEFLRPYSRAGLLVLEGADLLAGRMGAQRYVVRLFDSLQERGVPLVVTIGKPLAELTGLLPELQSRLKEGMVCFLSQAEWAELIRWLEAGMVSRSKPEHSPAGSPAGLFGTEGFTRRQGIRSKGAAALVRGTPGASLAAQAFGSDPSTFAESGCGSDLGQRPSLQEIAKLTAAQFDLRAKELRGPRRHRATAMARHLAMYLARVEFSYSLVEIGAFFGGRDHATILHACRKVAALCRSDRPTAEILVTLAESLRYGEARTKHLGRARKRGHQSKRLHWTEDQLDRDEKSGKVVDTLFAFDEGGS